MSLQHCSLALETEMSGSDSRIDVPLTLVVDKCYVPVIGGSARILTLNDDVELGGTITVSF